MQKCGFKLKINEFYPDNPGPAVFSIVPTYKKLVLKRYIEWYSTSDGNEDLS